MSYQVDVRSKEAAANGDVHLDVSVQSDHSGDWVEIPGGHRTLVMNGEAILAITNSSGTVPQKRQALAALFREGVKEWGLDQSDEASVAMGEIVEFPIVVNL